MPEFMTLHENAMALAEKALGLQNQGRNEEAHILFRSAFDAERRVVLESKGIAEPYRSILFRSAATLGIDCKAWRETEDLIYVALAGSPPESLRRELKDLLQKTSYFEHLEIRGIQLTNRQMQISFAGPDIGYGVAESDLVIVRLNALKKMIFRTAARKMELGFEEAESSPCLAKSDFETFIGVPRPQSFALTVQIGHRIQQGRFGKLDQEQIIDEVTESLGDFANADIEKLKKTINSEIYLRNFIELARRIAPDGEKITTVGITTIRMGKEKATALTRPAKEIVKAITERGSKKAKDNPDIEIVGRLNFADSTGKKDIIKIRDHNGQDHRVSVPSGMMADIVKPLWDNDVVIRGKQGKDIIFLEAIDPAYSS